MPLECLCRLVNADMEFCVAADVDATLTLSTASSSSATPSFFSRAETHRSSNGKSHATDSGNPGGNTHARHAASDNVNSHRGSMIKAYSRVAGTPSTPSSMALIAYTDLLRTVATRLKRDGIRRGLAHTEGRRKGVWTGIKTLDLGAVFR